MVNNKKCPNCESEIIVKNGFTNPDKLGRKKQKYLCTDCKKNFVEKKEALTRTEKRLFSLLYNLIISPVNKEDDLKAIVSRWNEEAPLIGKLDLEVTPAPVDLNSLHNIKVVICAKDEDIKIIKTYPEMSSIHIRDWAKIILDLNKYD